MMDQYNIPFAPVIEKIRSRAEYLAGDYSVFPHHLFIASIEEAPESLSHWLNDHGFNLEILDESVCHMANVSLELKWSDLANNIIEEARSFASIHENHFVGVEHVMLACTSASPDVQKLLRDNQINISNLQRELHNYMMRDITDDSGRINIQPESPDMQYSGINEEGMDPAVCVDNACINLNELALQGKLPQVTGRESEITQVIESISRKTKNNCILVGEAGVGKTAVVEGFVNDIIAGEVPTQMLPMQVFSLNLAALVAGTKYRGEFEERVVILVDFFKQNKNAVLFIDEIHTLVGAGGAEGTLDASNILKPALSRGEIRCIGATTESEYKKHFEKDSALKRRFEPISIGEPSAEDTKGILYVAKKSYSNFHSVVVDNKACDQIVDLCGRFIGNERFPDKALDVLDKACSKLKSRHFVYSDDFNENRDSFLKNMLDQSVEESEAGEMLQIFLNELTNFHKEKMANPPKLKSSIILEVISEKTGIPISYLKKNQNNRNLLDNLQSDVFGQKGALEKVSELLDCASVGINDPNRPLASFLFVGPTSVGKTHTAKAIAKHYFGNHKNLLRLDMSQMKDSTSIQKLLGSNAGFVGYGDGAQLTDFVRKTPNCVVLFDEIEKASPSMTDVLLQILEEGEITDGLNRVVDFTGCVIILTSNVKGRVTKQLGFQPDNDNSDPYENGVKEWFRPEFLARLDDTIVFKDLSHEDLVSVVTKEYRDLQKLLNNKGVDFKFSSKVCEHLAVGLKDKQARDVRKIFRKEVTFKITDVLKKDPKKRSVQAKIHGNSIVVA